MDDNLPPLNEGVDQGFLAGYEIHRRGQWWELYRFTKDGQTIGVQRFRWHWQARRAKRRLEREAEHE